MPARVLLIEDNQQNRYLATFLLEQSGFLVTSAADGIRGIALAVQMLPDVILLDIQLPGLNGYDVARALRQNAVLTDVPIVAVTALALHGDRERALAAGCNGYLEKPIDPASFVASITSFLRPGGGQ